MLRKGCLLWFLVILLFAVNAEANVPVIVKVSSTANISAIAGLLNGSVLDSIPEANTYLLSLPNLPLLTSTLQLLGVQWIDANKFMTLPGVVPVAMLSVPANVAPDWYKYQPAMQLIRSNSAQAYSTGRAIVVADINSQVDYGHPALIGHLTSGHDFVANTSSSTTALNQSSAGFLDDQSSAGFLDDQSSAGFLDQSSAGFLDNSGVGILSELLNPNEAYSHGTLCAGVIAAVAPDAMIMPLRAFDDNGNADTFTLAKAIRYAAQHGAQVLNMSFGTLKDVKVLREAIQYAQQKNVILIASAGNNNTSTPQYPASYSGVSGVAATDQLDHKGWFSNYGSSGVNVYLDAPGVNIISPYPGNRYSIVSGTSFSAPAVAGAVALVRSLKATNATSYVSNNVVKIDRQNPNYVGKLGVGRVDVLNAVKAAAK